MSTYTREEHFNRLKLACDELKSALCDIFQNDIPVDSLMITDYQNNIEKKLNNIRDVYIPAQMFLHSIKTQKPLRTCNHCGGRIEIDYSYVHSDNFGNDIFTCPKCNTQELLDNMD